MSIHLDTLSELLQLRKLAEAERLRSIIDSGIGLTNKPISSKRMAKLKRNLSQIEADLNDCKA